ncbi:MAG: DUF2179 domain-containing protein [Syntrophomonadaceae bacterium]|nr:DUF2179 domain-containing protein [Syntrophomonadaceae bacterium]
MHFGRNIGVLHAIVSNRELQRLKEMVQVIDPKAFMIINRGNEVRGRGFSLGKKYYPK